MGTRHLVDLVDLVVGLGITTTAFKVMVAQEHQDRVITVVVERISLFVDQAAAVKVLSAVLLLVVMAMVVLGAHPRLPGLV
jgi:hypothetical protein